MKKSTNTVAPGVNGHLDLGMCLRSPLPTCRMPRCPSWRPAGPLRYIRKREEWDNERILADKLPRISRSDRGESSRGCYHLITNVGDSIDTEIVELADAVSFDADDLDLHYGVGFTEWTEEHVETLGQKNPASPCSRGRRALGKTSFLRHLMFRLRETHRFYFIPPANAGVLSNSKFIGFWSQQHATHPGLRFVCVHEDAEGALMLRGTDNRRQAGAILNITDGLLADFLRLHILCSINCKSTEIDPAFMRPGRLGAHRQRKRTGFSRHFSEGFCVSRHSRSVTGI